MTTTARDVGVADRAALASLRVQPAAHFDDSVELIAKGPAACIRPPHHAALIAELFVRQAPRGRDLGSALPTAALEKDITRHAG